MHLLLHYIYTEKNESYHQCSYDCHGQVNLHPYENFIYTVCSGIVQWVLLPRWFDIKIYIVQHSINPGAYMYMLALREPTKE